MFCLLNIIINGIVDYLYLRYIKILRSVSPVLNILKNQKEVIMQVKYGRVRVRGGTYSVTRKGSEGYVQTDSEEHDGDTTVLIAFDVLKSNSAVPQMFNIKVENLEALDDVAGQVVYAVFAYSQPSISTIVGVYHLESDAEAKRDVLRASADYNTTQLFIGRLVIQ